MIKNDREILRAASVFLQYPQETTSDPELSMLQDGQEKRILEHFGAYRKAKPMLAVQEEYTRIFDLNPSISLNLSFHQGEAQMKGKQLLTLRELYEDAGYENVSGELPDYLPLILEFLTVCPDAHCRTICREYSGILERLASRLKEAESPYAPLMDLVNGFFSRNALPDEKSGR